MLSKPMLRGSIRVLGTLALCAGLSVSAFAQSQGDSASSVAEAARRAREQKKNAAKPAKTITNDEIPQAPANVTPAANPDNAAPAVDQATGTVSGDSKATDAKTKEKKAKASADLEVAKKDLERAQKELDVLQRQMALDSDAYYSKVDYQRDTDGKARLDAEAQQIADKKDQVDALKARVADLQAAAGESADQDRQPASQPQ